MSHLKVDFKHLPQAYFLRINVNGVWPFSHNLLPDIGQATALHRTRRRLFIEHLLSEIVALRNA
jgi:hypothetical protein